MKLKSAQIPRFLKAPDPAVRAVLVYGPDAGLVKERTETLARSVVQNLNDPFLVANFEGSELSQDPARLHDEAAALSLTGGRRVVRVRSAGDALNRLFEDFLSDPPGDTLVVVGAGDLSTRSSLRATFEKSKNGAALPCYADDGRSLEQLIREILDIAGLGVEEDALAYLRDNLGSDRLVSKQELEKLALYKSGADTVVTLTDVEVCVGDNSARDLEQVVLAACGGHLRRLDKALDRSLLGGDEPISILRAVASHLQRLHFVSGQQDTGIEAAMNKLRPRIFFKRADAFRAQLRAWTPQKLIRAMEIVTEAELGCKTTGMPADVICRHALLRIGREIARVR